MNIVWIWGQLICLRYVYSISGMFMGEVLVGRRNNNIDGRIKGMMVLLLVDRECIWVSWSSYG